MPRFTCIPFFNETSRFEAFTRGDRLTASKLGPLEIEAGTHEAAATKVFALLNSEDRPNGAFERSLSVGDVIVVERGESGRENFEGRHLAVEPHGFRNILD